MSLKGKNEKENNKKFFSPFSYINFTKQEIKIKTR